MDYVLPVLGGIAPFVKEAKSPATELVAILAPTRRYPTTTDTRSCQSHHPPSLRRRVRQQGLLPPNGSAVEPLTPTSMHC